MEKIVIIIDKFVSSLPGYRESKVFTNGACLCTSLWVYMHNSNLKASSWCLCPTKCLWVKCGFYQNTTIYVIWVNESVWGCLRPVILLSPLRTFPFSYMFYTNLFYWFSSRAIFSLFPGSIAVFVAFLKVTSLKRSLYFIWFVALFFHCWLYFSQTNQQPGCHNGSLDCKSHTIHCVPKVNSWGESKAWWHWQCCC